MKCPRCACDKAKYQMFSGGTEGWCPDCEDTFMLDELPADQQPRAVLLQSESGRIVLTAQMDQELARRRDETRVVHSEHVGGCNPGCSGDDHLLIASGD